MVGWLVDTDKDGHVNINQIIMDWVQEVNSAAIEDYEEEEVGAWDDVHGGTLPQGLVEEARKEEIGFMQGRAGAFGHLNQLKIVGEIQVRRR